MNSTRGESDGQRADSGAPLDSTPTGQRDIDALALKVRANAVLEHPDLSKRHDDITPFPQHMDSLSTSLERRQRSDKSTTLRLNTSPHPDAAHPREETIATSPNLSKHVIPVAEGAAGTLPAMQAVSPIEGTMTSPQAAKLPSLQQITGQIHDPLNVFAEVAAQQDPRAPPLTKQHSQSFGSATSQSPMTTYHPYPHMQASPGAQHALTARSPTTVISEHLYGSPPQHAHSAYFADRRPPATTDKGLRPPPLLPSASSSGESQGHASSTTDGGYSTAHTTPSELTQMPDGSIRPVLPPPPGMPILSGFKCDYPDCTAPPFQTQYLLSSHKNVHSSARNHFCPYEGCARGEGGKGFKRKNEMIRHQLVHKSPGYVCPFCPDREHKYPRPDNLQRHVRVHHVDKDRDDPELCEVLAKRSEGSGKARRRRNTIGSV